MKKAKRGPRKPKSLQLIVSDQIASAFERADWQLPPWWRETGAPVRPRSISGREFRGINTIRLWCAARDRGFVSPLWATTDQWLRYGFQPAPWEAPIPAVVYRSLRQSPRPRNRASGPLVIRPLMLFNANQLMTTAPCSTHHPKSRLTAGELVLATGADCIQDNECPAYHPSAGVSENRDRAHYLLSMLVRWTGAPQRLARKAWNCESASAVTREELIAEIGSAYIAADFGVAARPNFNSIDTSQWVQLLRQTPRAVFSIAADAERTARYVGSIFRRETRRG